MFATVHGLQCVKNRVSLPMEPDVRVKPTDDCISNFEALGVLREVLHFQFFFWGVGFRFFIFF